MSVWNLHPFPPLLSFLFLPFPCLPLISVPTLFRGSPATESGRALGASSRSRWSPDDKWFLLHSEWKIMLPVIAHLHAMWSISVLWHASRVFLRKEVDYDFKTNKEMPVWHTIPLPALYLSHAVLGRPWHNANRWDKNIKMFQLTLGNKSERCYATNPKKHYFCKWCLFKLQGLSRK